MNFDVENIRKDFPILSKKINNKPLIYFDNATCRYYNNGIIIKIMAIIKLRQLLKKNAVSVKAN